MTLAEVVDQYIAWRQARGAHFRSGASVLRLYCQSVGGEVDCDAVGTEPARVFLAGNGPLTRYRANKRTVLAGFYRYAISRGHATHSPLPADEPKEPSSAPPYIYSRDELRRLLAAVDGCRKQAVQLQADTFRTLLLLLYGAGLRRGEALRLTRADVDLSGALLTVRETKFYKSRLVPLGSHLTEVLTQYARRWLPYTAAAADDLPFLANRDGTPLVSSTVHQAFVAVRQAAGLQSPVGARRRPRLHDLRHSFAVHRLTSWYREGKDVQRLLPFLATYLGHTDIAGTTVYLSMTPELLHEASLRFERYAETATGGRDD